MRSCILVLAVMLLLSIASTIAAEESFYLQATPDVVVNHPPCDSTRIVIVSFVNTGDETITIDWTASYILRNSDNCPLDTLPVSGTVGPIMPGAWGHHVDTLWFDCDVCTQNSWILYCGSVIGNPMVTDCDTVKVICPVHGVPSHTNLGLIILVVLLLGSGMYVVYRRRVRTVV